MWEKSSQCGHLARHGSRRVRIFEAYCVCQSGRSKLILPAICWLTPAGSFARSDLGLTFAEYLPTSPVGSATTCAARILDRMVDLHCCQQVDVVMVGWP